MDHDPAEYAALLNGTGIDGESLTVLLVKGGTRADVLALLGAEARSYGTEFADVDDDDDSGYAAADVPGGVVAFEHTGYADPSTTVLAALSALGGAAAVARSNIQAHERFGCARDGVLQFDADEFMYVEEDEKDAVPAELHELFDSAWVDLEAEDDEDELAEGSVGFALAALHTGVRVTSADLRRAVEQGYHRVPTMTYLE